jgi:hypothetical protein
MEEGARREVVVGQEGNINISRWCGEGCTAKPHQRSRVWNKKRLVRVVSRSVRVILGGVLFGTGGDSAGCSKGEKVSVVDDATTSYDGAGAVEEERVKAVYDEAATSGCS